jgi:hypothetical protein
MDRKEIGCEDADSIHNRDWWLALVNTVVNLRISVNYLIRQ